MWARLLDTDVYNMRISLYMYLVGDELVYTSSQQASHSEIKCSLWYGPLRNDDTNINLPSLTIKSLKNMQLTGFWHI